MAPTPSRAPHKRGARGPVSLALALLLGAAAASCGSAGTDEASPTTEPASAEPSTTGADDRQDPSAGAASTSILDGWVTYELPDGWTATSEAEGLVPIRDDFETEPPAVGIDALEPLLELERDDGRARVSLLREPAFLDAADVDRWADQLAADLTSTAPLEPVGDEPVELAHGPGRRQVLESDDETVTLTTTAYGEQRIALLARAGADLGDDAAAQLVEVIESIALTPDVTLAPLLQFHAGLVGFDVAGERAAEIGLHVPSDWSSTDRPDGASYQSTDGEVTVDVTFTESVPVPSADVMRDLLAQRTDRDPLLSGDEREIGGGTFLVARHGPEDLTEVDLGTSWVLVGQVPGLIVTIELEDSGAEPDAPLLRQIIDSLVVEVP